VPPVRLHTQGGDFLEQTHFLKRGDPNQKDGVAPQGFLQVLMPAADAEQRWQTPPPAGWRTSYRRRALAAWMTDVDEGAGRLLARVIVNRLWQRHFGRGIVATPSDFGAQGERPTHPELLDWLAKELVDSGWSLKHVHKLMMTSAAYRESAAPSPPTPLPRGERGRGEGAPALADDRVALAEGLDRAEGGGRQEDGRHLAFAPGADGRHDAGPRQAPRIMDEKL